MSNEIDLETIPLEQLRDLANQAALENTDGPATPTNDEPAPVVKVEDEPAKVVAPPDEIVYRRSIDVGDGAGVQLFEGATLEELVDKLATAQENATRKIRELSAARKVEETKVDETTEDEDWVYSQELMSAPSKAFPKLIKKVFGKDVETIKNVLNDAEIGGREKRAKEVAKQFMATHPDLPYNNHNGTMVERYFQTYKMEVTPENLEKVFKELGDSGLLKPNPDNQDAPTKDDDGQPGGLPARTIPTVERKAASGLSSRRSATVPTRTQGPTEDELYNMPYEKLVELANQEAQARRQ